MKNLRKIILGAALAASIANVGIFAAASSSGDQDKISNATMLTDLPDELLVEIAKRLQGDHQSLGRLGRASQRLSVIASEVLPRLGDVVSRLEDAATRRQFAQRWSNYWTKVRLRAVESMRFFFCMFVCLYTAETSCNFYDSTMHEAPLDRLAVYFLAIMMSYCLSTMDKNSLSTIDPYIDTSW
ncbi:hypothetical protein K2W90_06445 [Candidatus Babeliales bacterium]|nr:hypothetical protein [Candidatus Babeliales bacterium]